MSNPNHQPQHAAEEVQDRLRREHAEPLMDKMDSSLLDHIDRLNEDVNGNFHEALDMKRNALAAKYRREGLSRVEALRRVDDETHTRQYERELKDEMLNGFNDEIEDLVGQFTVDLDLNDPESLDKVDAIYQSVEHLLTMPRSEWAGEDANGDKQEGGLIDTIADTVEDKAAQAAAAEYASDANPDPIIAARGTNPPVNGPLPPNGGTFTGRAPVPPENRAQPTSNQPAPGPNQPGPQHPNRVPAQQGPNHQPQSPNRQVNPNQALPAFEQRDSVVDTRYGANIGDTMVFQHPNQDGTWTVIRYEIMGFPARRQGEDMPPVTMRRTDERVDRYGNPVGQPVVTVAHNSSSHVSHIGRDVTASAKEGGIDLNHYWETMIPKRERKERWKKRRKKVIGGVALFAAGFAAARYGHDIASVADSVRNVFDMAGDQVGTLSPIVEHAHDAAGEAAQSGPTPEQLGLLDVFRTPIEAGMGGHELFNNLGLDPSAWNEQAADLAEKFPDDFYVIESGPYAGEVGLNHPGEPLSPQAAQYIAQTNGLWG